MKNIKCVLLGLTLSILFIHSQVFAGGHCMANETPIETFLESDKPVTINIDSRDWHTPWGYDKPENSDRKYPVFVFGRWGEEGYFENHELANGMSPKQRYPYFSLRSFHESSETEGENLADLIERMSTVHGYRIDMNRIYYEGFSWGGSGSYPLIRGMKNRGMFFAGVNRIAGQSQTTLPDEVISNTSIWYHLGLLDTPARITVARDAYAFVKDHALNTSATESIVNDTVISSGATYDRKTMTLTKNGVEIMKLSEYEGVGHAPGPPLSSSDVFHWLFSRSLCTESGPSVPTELKLLTVD